MPEESIPAFATWWWKRYQSANPTYRAKGKKCGGRFLNAIEFKYAFG
jgi:hypothetical protein